MWDLTTDKFQDRGETAEMHICRLKISSMVNDDNFYSKKYSRARQSQSSHSMNTELSD